jgi:hypothetical protein
LVLTIACYLFVCLNISGKNRECVNSPGSIIFRNIIDSYAEQYADAVSKVDKMAITKMIYLKVSETSRFLKFDETEKVWVEISSVAARDKVSHALRFASRETRMARQAHSTRSRPRSSDSSLQSETRDFGGSETTSLTGQFVSFSEPSSLCNIAEPSALPMDQLFVNECSEINQIQMFDTTVRDTLLLLQEAESLMANARNSGEGLPYIGLESDQKHELHPDSNIRGMKSGDLLSLVTEPIGEWQDARIARLREGEGDRIIS